VSHRKKSLVKIGEPSHTRRLTWWESEGAKNTTHFQTEFLITRFFATRFFQMPADLVGIGGGKKHHAFPDGAFSNARADVVGNPRGENTPHSVSPKKIAGKNRRALSHEEIDVVGIGGKKHHAFPDRAFSNARADVVGNRVAGVGVSKFGYRD
jgi:hypothetical protein